MSGKNWKKALGGVILKETLKHIRRHGMPIFEYRCMKCDKYFEVLVFGDQEVSCPTCKGAKVKKLLSTFSHKSDSGFTSSQGSSCGSCGAPSCSSCGSSS